MKNRLLSPPRQALLALVLASPLALPAADLAEPVPAEDPAFAPVAKQRTEGIMKELEFGDADRVARVRRLVRNFMVDTKNINEGSKVPDDRKRSRLEQARATLYAGFDAEKLDDAQRLAIKNGLSANHYRINYDAFLNLVPDLTEEQKQYIHEQLADVCDEAILLNSGSAKGELFIDRRGRINNYLSKEGYDLKALSKERNERMKRGREGK